MHVGDQTVKPMSLALLSDWGERAQTTPVQFERRRVLGLAIRQKALACGILCFYLSPEN